MFFSKVYLSDVYMNVWVLTKDIKRLSLVVITNPGDMEPLISFHLTFYMGCVSSVQFFLVTTKLWLTRQKFSGRMIGMCHHTILTHFQTRNMSYMILTIYLSLYLFDWPPCTHNGLIVGWWGSRPEQRL